MIKPYYDHDGITIYHADCRDVLPQLDKVDLVLTDPPYGVGKADWDRYPTQEELDLFREKSVNGVAMFGAAPPHCVYALMSLIPIPDRIFVWHNTFTLTHSDGNFWQWQPIYVWGKKVLCGLGKDVLQYPATDDMARWHPAQKSIKLMNALIGATESTVILDPFMGSGTTLVAAKNLGRRAIGIEIEQKYCDIAIRRLAQEVLPLGV
jgi:site-specific DNA-methyltransferase (adenine-specific)